MCIWCVLYLSMWNLTNFDNRLASQALKKPSALRTENNSWKNIEEKIIKIGKGKSSEVPAPSCLLCKNTRNSHYQFSSFQLLWKMQKPSTDPPPHPPPTPLPLPPPPSWHTFISIRINKLSKTFLITGTGGLAWLHYQEKIQVRIPPSVWFGKKSLFRKCLTIYNFFN